ncbi:MAG: 30S ribosomal protein S8, partial [candidate division WOR-3 bacterium]
DPIADMLTIIRNGIRARHKVVTVPYSKIKMEIARILMEEGYINNFQIDSDEKPSRIEILLRYSQQGEPAIKNLVRISKPGRRVYVAHDEIPKVNRGLGIAILSTNKGIVTDREARKMKAGGEVLGYVF